MCIRDSPSPSRPTRARGCRGCCAGRGATACSGAACIGRPLLAEPQLRGRALPDRSGRMTCSSQPSELPLRPKAWSPWGSEDACQPACEGEGPNSTAGWQKAARP
eukprot:4613646-Alexandrium_andersonii.AAC.1